MANFVIVPFQIMNNALHEYLDGSLCTTDGIVECLKAKISINSNDRFGATPLHHAVENENCSMEVIKYLLENGADIQARDKWGQTPLHYLVENFRKNAIDIARLLLDYGAEIEDRDYAHCATLHHAVGTASNLDMVKFLLDRGANFQVTEGTESSTLQYALMNEGDYDIIKLLLDRGANANDCYECGQHALHTAAEFCSPRVIKLLIDYGAQVNVVNNYNNSPLYVCVRHKKIESSEMLLEYGALVSCGHCPLYEAIYHYHSSKDGKTLKHLQLLLKYTLLENTVLNLEDEYRNSIFPVELIDYRSKCRREIGRMHSISVDNTNFLQFVFQLRQELRHKDKDEKNRILNKLLHVIDSNEFPLYYEIITILLRREYLEDYLENLVVYTVSNQIDRIRGSDNRVFLNLDALHILTSYLSEKDLLNFVLAFYNF